MSETMTIVKQLREFRNCDNCVRNYDNCNYHQISANTEYTNVNIADAGIMKWIPHRKFRLIFGLNTILQV